MKLKAWRAAIAALAVAALSASLAFADTVADETLDVSSGVHVESAVGIDAAGIPEADALNYEWDPSTWEEPAVSLIDVSYEGTAADIVIIAQAEPNGVPDGGTRNKYNNYNGEPWCAYFVVWCARQADVDSSIVPALYECNTLANYYKDQGRWHSYNYTPSIGDLIFYSTYSGGRACHVGIVTDVSDGYVYAKEANTADYETAVRRRTVGASYVASGWYVLGYASPNYNVHSHNFNQVSSAVSSAGEDESCQHSVTYVPKCACGATAGIVIKTESCSWIAVGEGYECQHCARTYDMTQEGDRYLLFADVAAEVVQKGAQNVWYVSQGWLDKAVESGLMQGVNTSSGCCFNPYADVTRAQVATILYRAACASDPALDGVYGSTVDSARYATAAVFSDAEGDAWYTAAINWAKDAGVMVGDGGAGGAQSAVRPHDPITREELCLMLARYANDGAMPEVELDVAKAQGIQGLNQVSSWAEDGVIWAVNNGVAKGDGNADGTSSMNPRNNTSRAATAKMISVVLEVIAGQEPANCGNTSL